MLIYVEFLGMINSLYERVGLQGNAVEAILLEQ